MLFLTAENQLENLHLLGLNMNKLAVHPVLPCGFIAVLITAFCFGPNLLDMFVQKV